MTKINVTPYKQVTIDDVLSVDPSDQEYQSNKYKIWRESWLVAQFCKSELIDGFITAPYEEPIDVMVEFKDKKLMFQCVECKNKGPRGNPLDHPIRITEDGLIMSGTMGSKNPHIDVHQRLIDAIEKKEGHYDQNICKNIILLVYENIYWSTKEDINLPELQRKLINTKFKSIYIRHNAENLHVAGQKLEDIISNN